MNVSVSCAYTQGKREQFSGFNRTLDAINNVFRKFSAFHDETGRLNVDGMNIISNDGSNKLNRSRKARVSYKVQRTINASLNAATSTRDRKSGSAGMPRPISYAVFCLKKKTPNGPNLIITAPTALSDHDSNSCLPTPVSSVVRIILSLICSILSLPTSLSLHSL